MVLGFLIWEFEMVIMYNIVYFIFDYENIVEIFWKYERINFILKFFL